MGLLSTSTHRRGSAVLLATLGVVYGDIGTSPLYALRECFYGSHKVDPTHDNVLGVLSLIIYSLVLVISIKYIALVLKADNQGEGGILALTALLPARGTTAGRVPGLVLLGLFGAALLYGDGMITPAITVLGAIEGLNVATPVFEPYVVPITVVIIIGVFAIQQHGTARVGGLFGPVMVLWFLTLAGLGVRSLLTRPEVLGAIDPRHAVSFFYEHGLHGVAVLGAVFLVVTGGEALYADMGHFGTRPIRLAWFGLVLPALLLNYFGQGALLLNDASAAANPFFRLAPAWATLPLVALAAAAAIIASQALISGVFSLTRQAIQLGYCPRLDIEHTSSREIGQVYVPQANWALMLCTLGIVVGFGSSTALAAAYGIAVTLTMTITVLLLSVVAHERWRWPLPLVGAVMGLFLLIDVAFVSANVLKIAQGGWLPLAIGAFIFTLMTTWKTGRRILADRLTSRSVPIEEFVASLPRIEVARVPGTAIFMTAQPRGTPPALAHNLRHNKVLHEQVVTLVVTTLPMPYVPEEERLWVRPMGHGIFDVALRVGFMEDVDIPKMLQEARHFGLAIDADATYFLGRETLLVTPARGMAKWREQLFVFMSRNAGRAAGFFRLPSDRVVELGVQVEL
ncbi:MAG TPA: potassium transporter Kup [Vicinamibacterales bacterium]|nr:potassium transporter Kup [Vicinamibacterales bacterium]